MFHTWILERPLVFRYTAIKWHMEEVETLDIMSTIPLTIHGKGFTQSPHPEAVPPSDRRTVERQSHYPG